MFRRKNSIGLNNGTFELDEGLDRFSQVLPSPLRILKKGAAGGLQKSVSIDLEDEPIPPPAPMPSIKIAVSVQNAYKTYGGGVNANPVLKCLNMTVKQGTIYSLLGASGSGKTSLLSCIVGLRKLDSGEIYVNGWKTGSPQSGVPGKRVGMMPQETALFGEYSIHECLYFYGRLYSMSRSQIEENITFLMDFLNLPTGNKSVKNLSGGQQRRVSFACSMIHNPELLVLDEPTVGVDALLRQSIWDHLVKLVSTGQTSVVITTHYIEEIGLMRNGKLLVEDSPSILLNRYKTNLLEDIVMKLCLKDSNQTMDFGNSYTNNLAITDETVNGNEGPAALEQNEEEATKWRKLHRASLVSEMKQKSERVEKFHDAWNRLVALSIKNFLTSIRNLLFLAFILISPAVHIAIVCLAIGGDPKGLSFAVVNSELSANSSCALNAGRGCPLSENYTGLLSCQFMRLIDDEYIELKLYRNEEEALEDVKESRVWGILKFPHNYTKSIQDRGIFGSSVDLDVIYGSRIGIEMDFSNKQISSQIKKDFYNSLEGMMRNISLECGFDPATLETPLSFEKPVYGDKDMTFREYIAPSVLLGILFFFPLSSSGLNYISEKRLGLYERAIIAGVTNFEFMLAYAGVQLIILFIQTSLAFAFMVFVFGIHIHGPFIWAYALALLVGFAGITVGFILAAVCSQEVEAVILSMGMFIPNILLAGMLWVMEGMPLMLKYIAYALPCTLACESMRSIVSRGVTSLSHPKVWPGFASTIIWILFYWILLFLINKFKSRN